MNWIAMLTSRDSSLVTISPDHLNQWLRHATLDMLHGKTMGQSFCDYFDIQDYIIQFERDPDRVMQYTQRYVSI